MSRLGVLVICLVAGGVLFFALSLRSSKFPAEDDPLGVSRDRDAATGDDNGVMRGDFTLAGPGARHGAVRKDEAGAALRRGVPPKDSRLAALSRKSGSRPSATAPGSVGSRRSPLARERVADVSSASVNSRPAGQSARRKELVDFIASQEHLGPGGAGTAEGGTAASASGEEAEPDADGVLLSVPLAGAAEAEGDGYTQPIAEENLHPSDEGDGIEFPKDSVLEFPDAGNIQGEEGSIQLEIEPNWSGTDPGDNSFVQVRSSDMWQGRVSLWRNGKYLRFVWFDNDGVENGVGVSIDAWAPGERHAVTATWGEALMSLYIDGQLAGQNTYSGELSIPPGTPLFIGSNPRHHVPGADATMSNFKVYGRALAPEEISDR